MAATQDFYGLYNIIFKWIEENYGRDELIKYWEKTTFSCYGDVITTLKQKGLIGIKNYYDELFDKENCNYKSHVVDGCLLYDIENCPPYNYFNNSKNPFDIPLFNYCEHCFVQNTILAKESGNVFEVLECNNKGGCKLKFYKKKGDEK